MKKRIKLKATKTPFRSRMERQYDITSLEANIKQHYNNAAVLDGEAMMQREKARRLEKMISDLQEINRNE